MTLRETAVMHMTVRRAAPMYPSFCLLSASPSVQWAREAICAIVRAFYCAAMAIASRSALSNFRIFFDFDN